ncbi:MAG: hypothetical protein PHS33_08040 [Candidatus Omnitrophica bacterium]|nr:hypothetical protein [Candidatus Omnitrophota bacterium]MDD5264704.1 hypothetical protein [Candidatus Bipolaricaulis sp.]
MNSIEAGVEARKETLAAMNEMDLGLTRGLSKLNDLLEAQKPIAALIVGKPGKDKKSKDADEATHDFVDVPDNQTQIKALDMLFKLGDHYPSQKIDANVNHQGNIMAAVVNHLSGNNKQPTAPKVKEKSKKAKK